MENHTITTRSAAAAAGYRYYYTGKPCKNDHLAQRYVSTGNCKACQKSYSKDSASATRKQYVCKLQGLFTYALHADDHAKALAYCQALDMDRGRTPQAPAEVAPLGVRTFEQIQEDRARIFSGLRQPEKEVYVPKL